MQVNLFRAKRKITQRQRDELQMIAEGPQAAQYLNALRYFQSCAEELGTNNLQCGIIIGLYLAKADKEFSDGMTEFVRRGQAIVNNTTEPGQDALRVMVQVMLNNKDI